MKSGRNQIEARLAAVDERMAAAVRAGGLEQLLPPGNNILDGGKRLRARLVLVVGAAGAKEEKVLVPAAAAVEMIHGASLLHDDVIDGGVLRRGAATFWKRHGVNGAILLGDLLVLQAMELLADIGRPDLLRELIARAGDVCRSEIEQELLSRGKPGSWEDCERIARAKTGSLFAFAAYAAADPHAGGEQAAALREAGFLLGTAYQLADDLLDASGDEALSGKTLGSDRARGKVTALSASGGDPVGRVEQLLEASSDLLRPWPAVFAAWETYLDFLRPLLRRYLASAPLSAGAPGNRND